MTHIETTDEQMIRLLRERRGELLYDLRRAHVRQAEIADELTKTERAITELEGNDKGNTKGSV